VAVVVVTGRERLDGLHRGLLLALVGMAPPSSAGAPAGQADLWA
jgi:hypothetical protein